MNGLDDVVRAAMRTSVAHPPAMRSPADRAIAGARGRRRRRTVTAIGAGVAVLALTLGGAVALRAGTAERQPNGPATAPVSDPPAVPVYASDVLADGDPTTGWRTLRSGPGRTVSLAEVRGRVEAAYATPDGWLVVSADPEPGDSLWLLRPDGSAHRLITGSQREPAIAPGGRRFAWRADGRLYVGHLSGTALTTDASTPAPTRGAPLAYTGSAVVLGYSTTGGGVDTHDVWVPDRGAYVASWDRAVHVRAVYQPGPDGSLYGLARSSAALKSSCLARLDPAADLAVLRSACGLPLTVDPSALVSPDGRWLAAPAFIDDGPRVTLLDLDRVFDAPAVAATWEAVSPVTWLDAGTLVVRGENGSPMVVRPGHPGVAVLIGPDLPGGEPVEPVRRLG
jgi:hypothetical protein